MFYQGLDLKRRVIIGVNWSMAETNARADDGRIICPGRLLAYSFPEGIPGLRSCVFNNEGHLFNEGYPRLCFMPAGRVRHSTRILPILAGQASGIADSNERTESGIPSVPSNGL